MNKENSSSFLIVTGTNRPDSNSEIIARQYAEYLDSLGQHAELFLLKNLPRDFVFTDMWDENSSAMQRIIDDLIVPMQKVVFVVPEYNGGFPGVLKAFIDCIPPKLFHGKKAGLIGVSSGMAGGLRPMDQMTNVLNYLKVNVLYNKPKLSGIDGLLDNPEKRITDERAVSLLKEHAQLMINF